MSSNDHFLEKVQISDKAIFNVSGAVNRRNVRIWGVVYRDWAWTGWTPVGHDVGQSTQTLFSGDY